MEWAYPVVLERDDNGSMLVTVPDIPEAHTFGDDEEEALARAVDAIETALMGYMADRRPIPAPSRRRGKLVTLPALAALKVQLYAAMGESRVGKAELARRLDWHLPQVDRILDLRHQSRLDQLEAALAALNRKLVVDVAPVEMRRTTAASRSR